PVGMLPLDRLGTATFTDFLLLVVNDRDQVGHGPHVGFETCRGSVYTGREHVADRHGRGLGRISSVGHSGSWKTSYGIPAERGSANFSTILNRFLRVSLVSSRL